LVVLQMPVAIFRGRSSRTKSLKKIKIIF